MIAIIYHAFDTSSGKAYVGQTWDNLERRRKEHEYHAGKKNHPFYNALYSHGNDVFVWSVLTSVQTQEELDDAEVSFIKELRTKFPEGYNIADGGRGSKGFKHSEEWKQKMTKRLLGRRWKMSEEGRKNISSSQVGKKRGPMTAAHRAAISLANKGKRKPHKGVPRTLETRRLISQRVKEAAERRRKRDLEKVE